MATLAQIMDEMADTIRGVVSQITDVAVQVEPRMVLGPTPPTVDIYPGTPSNDPELGGFGEEIGGELINVRIRINPADNDGSQDVLLALMDDEDPLSIINALLDDPSLNGLASDVAVRSRTGYVAFQLRNGQELYGCLIGVEVIKARS